MKSTVWAYPSEYDAAASAWLSGAVDSWVRELYPFLASARRERVADLTPPEEHASETAELASPLFRSIEIEQTVTIDVQDTLDGDVDLFLTKTFKLANDYGSQLMDKFLAHIIEVSDMHDQTIDAKGRDFIDVIIKALETLDVSFDEDGKHDLTLFVHPDTAKKIKNAKLTPAQEARMQQVLKRRQEEWNASRRRYDLP